jgi:flagellar protein FlaG
MNEVNVKQPAVVDTAGRASSKVAAAVNTNTARAEPASTTAEVKAHNDEMAEQAVLSSEKVSQAVAEMNKFIQSEQRNLSFSIDEGSGVTVVKVIDRSTGELIRQMPNQTFLDLAESARKYESLNLISVYG